MDDSAARQCSHDDANFLIDGQPIQIFSGELHYFRIPRPYWRDRLLKAKALGLNAVCTYMPWNLHEPRPGEFDFDGDGGMLDVAAFVRLAREVGLWVLLRPGPYICAEWDFGGLPGWLLANDDCRVRCADETYLAAVGRYIARVGEELAPLTCGRGGPIILVQVENEYGSYSNDKLYLRWLRQVLLDAGLGNGTLLFTSDGPQDDMLAAGTLDECVATANFGSKAPESLDKLAQFRPNQRLMCGEFWCGWFDQWGKKRQGNAETTTTVNEIRHMVERSASFNIYMLHGGTNFGFTAGANYYDGYSPTVTGYDYWALLDEAGRPTAKYDAVRRILAERRAAGAASPEAPASRATVSIPPERVHLTESAPLLANLPRPIHDAAPRSMEHYDQYLGGAILYRTRIAGLGGGKLSIVDPHDYAIVYLDGVKIGALDRRLKQTMLELPETPRGAEGRLDILVWALGRVNYGPRLLDRKGITDRVELKHLTLSDWEVFPFPMEAQQLSSLRFEPRDAAGPAFHRGRFELREDEIGDTFMDMSRWSAGAVWVNGHNLGRFWSIGPQQTLFCPGCWLRSGANEVVIFDLESAGRQPITGLAEPILDTIRT